MVRIRKRRLLIFPIKLRRLSPRLLVVILVGLSLVLAYNLVQRWTTIQRVKVGVHDLICDDPKAIEYFLNLGGKNLLNIQEGSLQNSLKAKFRCVGSLRLLKHLPNQLVLDVVGRRPLALLVNESTPAVNLALKDLESSASSNAALLNFSPPQPPVVEYMVDDSGLIFGLAPSELSLPIIYTETELSLYKNYDSRLLKEALDVIDQLQRSGISSRFYRVDGTNNFLVETNEGMDLAFSLNRDVNVQIASLQLILQKNKIESKQVKSIDLRFSRPVVVYYGKR